MLRNSVLALLVFLLTAPTLSAQDLSRNKQEALHHAEAISNQVYDMAMSLWSFSETAMLEYKSAEKLIEHLEAEGFSINRGVAGMPTAFTATYGSGAPSIGILAEYDALPGVGNAPAPGRQPREDGVTSGHGCGHNLFGAASVGGAIALKRTMDSQNLTGTITLYGTPAEETLIGKVYMAKAGLFDDLDAVVEWHPGLVTGVNNQPGLSMNNFEVEFFGQAAHGAADPWNGRSALDAVEMMNFGVNLMREHIKPTTRIHYVMPNAGEAPNVVPEYAKAWYYVRDVNRQSVNDYYSRILDIAKGAALGTRTEHKVFLITGVHEYNLNRPLQEAVQANLEAVGPPIYTDDEQQFAKQLQAYLEIEEEGYSTEIKPLKDEPEMPSGGSTDVAEVSYITPTVGFSVTTAAAGVPWHSWATSSCHGTDASVKGAQIAARVIALTGVDLLTDDNLLEDAQAFFMEKTGGATYQSPIPVDQAPPLPED